MLKTGFEGELVFPYRHMHWTGDTLRVWSIQQTIVRNQQDKHKIHLIAM